MIQIYWFIKEELPTSLVLNLLHKVYMVDILFHFHFQILLSNIGVDMDQMGSVN